MIWNPSKEKIYAFETDEGCEIRISNNGPFINSDGRKNLFLPFYTTKGKRGTGLGLKISKDLALANNGDLVLSEND
jgi:C4-dicarboxylate-specific signal transduction histidine kinase